MHWMDQVQVWALKKRHCFRDGWGDLSFAEALADHIRDPGPAAVVRPDLGPPTRVLQADLRIGTFPSPSPHLPEESRTARFWWLHPADQPVRGAALAFASWGDEGPTLRGRLLGSLVREGVSIVILENPFYGVRRRQGQRAGGLRTVRDFMAMQAAAFDEGRALLGWMSREIQAPTATVGFSMGGHLAGALACVSAGPTPVAILAPPRCPSQPFTDGPLAACIDWDALGGPRPEVRDRWRAIMDLFDLLDFPAPREPSLARVIGCRTDGLVPVEHAEHISARWSAPLEWVPVGHVGAALTHGKALRRAVREVLGIPSRSSRPLLTTMASQTLERLRPSG
ncbi:MAG: abhydrolase domain-containing 18 [Deltaproteobacteria bacterium]|nr:MAG: abhydrolase domain-containing 18 [Deltaproteobacteria bacterium]